MSDGDDRDRPQTAGDGAKDSQAFTGGDHEVQSICRTNLPRFTRPTRSQVRINASLLCDGKSICA